MDDSSKSVTTFLPFSQSPDWAHRFDGSPLSSRYRFSILVKSSMVEKNFRRILVREFYILRNAKEEGRALPLYEHYSTFL